MPRRRSALALLGAAAFLLLAWGVLPAPEAQGEDAVVLRLLGKAKSVETGGVSFDLSARGGPYRVEVVTMTAVFLAQGTTLEALDGAAAKILARFNKARASRDAPTEASYSQILALVAGQDYVAPSEAAAGAPKEATWHDGSVGISGRRCTFGGVNLGCGVDRAAWMIQIAKPIDVREGPVLVEGAMRKEGKVKVISATRVVLLGAKIPSAEVDYVFGPTVR